MKIALGIVLVCVCICVIMATILVMCLIVDFIDDKIYIKKLKKLSRNKKVSKPKE